MGQRSQGSLPESFLFAILRKGLEKMSETSDTKDSPNTLDENGILAPAADISHVEQGKAKQSQPSVRDNVLAFCIVFCQLVQVSH